MKTWLQVECASCGERRLAWEAGDGLGPFEEACPHCKSEAYRAD